MFFAVLALAAASPVPVRSVVDPPPPRPMTLEVQRDPITDQVRARASLYDSGQRLDIACDPARYEGVQVSFSTRHWFAGDSFFTGERPIIYRFDSQPPRRFVWIMRDRGARLSGRGRVAYFLSGLIVAEQLVFRSRDVEDHRLDLTFRIVGAYPAISELLQACGEGAMRRTLFGPI